MRCVQGIIIISIGHTYTFTDVHCAQGKTIESALEGAEILIKESARIFLSLPHLIFLRVFILGSLALESLIDFLRLRVALNQSSSLLDYVCAVAAAGEKDG